MAKPMPRAERGSASVEFVLVGALLTLLTLAVLQLALVLHIRNTVLDAAAEGARVASLADNQLGDGVQRTVDLIDTAIGPAFATDVTADYSNFLGVRAVAVTVRTPLPLVGLFGPHHSLEVAGHAALESLE